MASEVFALTDEQIVGLAPEEGEERAATSDQDADKLATEPGDRPASEGGRYKSGNEASTREERGIHPAKDAGWGGGPRSADSARDDGVEKNRSKDRPLHEEAGAPQVAPQWLAERMKDPWCGDQATEFWEATQNAQREAAAYRDAFASLEDARALKEIYPGGIGEAKAAAERARALDEIDAAFYRGDGAARMQLAQRMMTQDPAAFREMVEAGLRLLGQPVAAQPANASAANSEQRSANGNREESAVAQTGVSVSREVAVPSEVTRAYGEFEKSANAELEKSVGGAIARAMEQALPNLRAMKAHGAQHDGEATPLQERLAGAVREEIEAGLKNDRQLGEQVARLLAGRRFDREARTQVVRLIDRRAQQLVPGAVKRVVSSWTSTTLAAKGKEALRAQNDGSPRPGVPGSRLETERAKAARASGHGRRFDYGRVSDEDIVGL